MGKTSFSQYLALAWCAVHDESEECVRMREKMKKFKLFNDIEYLKETQLLFLLHFRDFENESDCKKMLITFLQSDLGYSDEETSDLLSYINSPETVLLMDGLDEWKCTANKIPKYTSVSEARIICTSRPWKIDSCVTARMQDYNKITITGIGFDFVKRLVHNVTDHLMQKSTVVRKNTADFIQILKGKELQTIISLNTSASDELLMIPVLILQLLCRWHDNNDFGRTRTQIYINMAETLLRRLKKMEGIQYKKTTCSSPLPVLFKTMEAKCCIEQSEHIANLSKLAFYLLFTGPTEYSLQFSEKDLSSLKLSGRNIQEIKDTFKEIGQSGIIQGTARKSCSSQDKIYSFIHKSYQEFFAALHIVAKKCDTNICQEITANTKTLQDVIELVNVFDFVCGSDSTCIEAMVSLIDNLTSKHVMQTDDIKMIQDMIVDSCCKYVNEVNVSINLSNLFGTDSFIQKHILLKDFITVDNKRERHNLEITLNKKVGVLCLTRLPLPRTINLTQFDIEELILDEVRTGKVILSKVGQLKRIKLCLLEPTNVYIPFQKAENLKNLEMTSCSLSGPLDLSQCPLNILMLDGVITEKVVTVCVETCKVKNMNCSFEFKKAIHLIDLSMMSCSLSGSLDLSQCRLKVLNLNKVHTKKVVIGHVGTCSVVHVTCSFDCTNAIKLTNLSMMSCSLTEPLDLSKCLLEKLSLNDIQTKKVVIGNVETCSVVHVNCSFDCTNAIKLTNLNMISCSLTEPLDLSKCLLEKLSLNDIQTKRVIIGHVETCSVVHVKCSLDCTNANKITNLSMMSCSLTESLDLSKCLLGKLSLNDIQTKKVVLGHVATCTVENTFSSFDFTNAILTELHMNSCAISDLLELSQCQLKKLMLYAVKAEKVVAGSVKACTVEQMDCSFDFTNAIKLTNLRMTSCSLPEPLDLSKCFLKELMLYEIKTERVVICCVETCTVEHMNCSFEFTNAIQLTNLSMMSCSLTEPLDLSKCPLEELNLDHVQTMKVVTKCVETCTVRDMDCSFEFTNAIKLTNLSMRDCALPDTLDLSKCPLIKLMLRNVQTNKVVTGCVETFTINDMDCAFDFTNKSSIMNLSMMSCSLPGPLDLSQHQIEVLDLCKVNTKKLVAGSVKACTVDQMDCSFEFTNATKLTNLSMISCSLPEPLDLSKCPLKELVLYGVKTKRVVISCVETCTVKHMNCSFEFANANSITNLSMISCSLPEPLDLSKYQLKELMLHNVITEKVVTGRVEKCSVKDVNCSFDFTNAENLTNLSMESCSLPGKLDLSHCPIKKLMLDGVISEDEGDFFVVKRPEPEST